MKSDRKYIFSPKTDFIVPLILLLVFLFAATGQAQYEVEWSIAQDYYESGMLYFDFNHDGSQELTKHFYNSITVYEGANDWQVLWSVIAAQHDELLLWNLFEQDEDTELAIFTANNLVDEMSTSLLVYESLADEPLWATDNYPGYYSFISQGHLDDDEEPEIVWGLNRWDADDEQYEARFFVLNAANGEVEFESSILNGYLVGPYIGDMDGDGQVEIMCNLYHAADTTSSLMVYSLPREENLVTVSFNPGWNLISLNILPLIEFWTRDEGPDVILMTEQLRFENNEHRLQLLKDEIGRFYAPAFNFSNIPFWNLTEGYQVNLSEAFETTWRGNPIPAEADLPLTEGWNFAAYFPSYELSAAAPEYYVLSSIIDQVLIAKDGAGRFLVPAFGFSNMPPWRESQGYQIRVEADVVLNYPPPFNEGAATELELQPSHWRPKPPTSENMSLLVKINTTVANPGDEIAAVSTSGQIVGVGVVTDQSWCGFAIWGADRSSELIEGLLEGETFGLRYWDSNQNLELKLEQIAILTGGGLSYLPDGFTAVTAEVQSIVPSQFRLGQNYPNPFNSTTQIPFGIPEASQLSIRIFDLGGRLVTTLTEGEYQAGYHSVTWETTLQATGIYLVKLDYLSGSLVRKIALVK